MPLSTRTAGPELRRLAGRSVFVRQPSQDDYAYRCVVIDNEYRLPEHFAAGDLVIDVGAQAGYFALAALARGAGKVICLEPAKDNAALCRLNLDGLPASIRPMAIWRSDYRESVFLTHRGDRLTAMHHTLGHEGQEVLSIGLDSLILIAAGSRDVRLLKLDCEGAEYPAVLTSRRLRQCREIVGELHHGYAPGRLPPDWNPDQLLRKLREQGFDVESRPHDTAPECLTLFRARRRPHAGTPALTVAKVTTTGEALAPI